VTILPMLIQRTVCWYFSGKHGDYILSYKLKKW